MEASEKDRSTARELASKLGVQNPTKEQLDAAAQKLADERKPQLVTGGLVTSLPKKAS